jgi:hypothetical protein
MLEEVKELTRRQRAWSPWEGGVSKDRFGEGVEDRDDLGSGERTEGASVPKSPGRKLAASGGDRRGNLTS